MGVQLPRTVIIDYYDSYTNNLMSLLTQLASDDEVLSKVVVIKADHYSWHEFQTSVLPNVDCIILSPGPGRPDEPKDIGFALELLRSHPVPILGVCLGHQAIGVAFGAKIINMPKITHGHVVPVQPVPDAGIFTPWADELGTFDAVVYNSLTVSEQDLPAELVVTAYSLPRDGSPRTIQGLAHRDWPIWGVQYHPESISSTHGADLLRCFLDRVHAYHGDPGSYPPLPDSVVAACAYRVSSLTMSAAGPSTPAAASLRLRNRRCGDLGRSKTTQEVYEAMIRRRRESQNLGEVWLDGKTPTKATTTSLALPSFIISYSLATRTVTLHSPSGVTQLLLPASTTFFSWFDAGQRELAACLPAGLSTDGFKGGWVGWFGYEMKAESLEGYASLPEATATTRRADAVWAWADKLIERTEDGEWSARAIIGRVDGRSDMIRWLLDQGVCFGIGDAAFDRYVGELETALNDSTPTLATPAPAFPKFRPSISGEAHMARIDACREYIRQGLSYELNQTTSFTSALPHTTGRSHGDCSDQAYALYLRLRAFNPAYYSCFLSFPSLDTPHGPGVHVLSSSPERFLRIQGGEIEMRPIKGTRARVKAGQSCVQVAKEEDAKRGRELSEDLKERAENLMIVDLIRSDLLSCCVPSTVKVPQLIALESYGVHNLVTTVRGHLSSGVGTVEAVKRCFPPGSMTGAPKLKSVQLLDGTEEGVARGIYSGALGYISVDGSTDLSVVIRTIVAQGDHLSIGAGGAITWLSEREQEWEEVLTKVQSVVGKLDFAST